MRRQHTRRLFLQKAAGLALIVFCIGAICIACGGASPAERDASAAVLFLPLGVYLLLTRRIVIS